MVEVSGAERRRVLLLSVTCLRDGHEHLVRDDAVTPDSNGRYPALCGHRVLAAGLICPAGPPCPDCATAERAAAREASRRRAGWLGRWTRIPTRVTALLRRAGGGR